MSDDTPKVIGVERTPAGYRIEYIDEMLLASGWRRSDLGWLAPESFRDDLAEEVGRGSVTRWIAIAAQVQIDESYCAAIAKAEGALND